MWPYEDPARAVAEAHRAIPARRRGCPPGAATRYRRCSPRARSRSSGANEGVVILTGAECGNTQAKARRAGVELDWRKAPGRTRPPVRHRAEDAPSRRSETRHPGSHPDVPDLRERDPPRARRESRCAHSARLGTLGRLQPGRGGQSARMDPGRPERPSRSARPPPVNRPVSFPYPKFMNSNSNVDQASALILTSAGTARRLGIPEATSGSTPGHPPKATTRMRSRTRDNLLQRTGARASPGTRLPRTGGGRSRRPRSRRRLQLLSRRPYRWPRPNSDWTRRRRR